MEDYLNIGSCDVRVDGAMNFDMNHGEVSPDVCGDTRQLPFKDESFKGVIAHHVLEHINDRHHKRVVFEWRRIIKEGGKISIKCPDFEGLCKHYVSNYLGCKETWHQHIFGRQGFSGDTHLSGISREYLTELLFLFGFHDLKWEEGLKAMPELAVIATKGEPPTWEI